VVEKGDAYARNFVELHALAKCREDTPISFKKNSANVEQALGGKDTACESVVVMISPSRH